jgi:hypothetical protein
MNIFVYKTDIISDYDLEAIDDLLSSHGTIICWNVDRDDVDKVLRIESTADNAEELLQTVTNAGYFCEELTD